MLAFLSGFLQSVRMQLAGGLVVPGEFLPWALSCSQTPDQVSESNRAFVVLQLVCVAHPFMHSVPHLAFWMSLELLKTKLPNVTSDVKFLSLFTELRNDSRFTGFIVIPGTTLRQVSAVRGALTTQFILALRKMVFVTLGWGIAKT